jgi:hypothetical protein
VKSRRLQTLLARAKREGLLVFGESVEQRESNIRLQDQANVYGMVLDVGFIGLLTRC